MFLHVPIAMYILLWKEIHVKFLFVTFGCRYTFECNLVSNFFVGNHNNLQIFPKKPSNSSDPMKQCIKILKNHEQSVLESMLTLL